MAYTTAAAVKTYLGITGSGDDTLITGLIAAAKVSIDRYCNRTFEVSVDSTKYYDAIGEHIRGNTLYLDDEIASITTVTNGDGVEVTSGQYTTLPRNETPYTAIRLLSNSGIVWTYSTEWMDAIEITGKWAYSTTASDGIAQACVRLASFMYRQKDAQLMDVTAIEAGVVLAPVGIPADVRTILNTYRRFT
jgi:hypothetical protein